MEIITYQIIHTTIRSATPILLAVIAAIVSKQANIFNIAIEGIMLFGALIAITVSALTNSWILAVIAAMAIGVLISIIIGFAHLKFNANILVLGFATNTLALGGTRLMMERFFGVVGAYAPTEMAALPRFNLDFLSDSPVLSSIFSGYSLLEILAYVFIFVLWFILYKTKTGLRLRAVGLHENAAETAGINVYRTKFVAILISGLFAGIAGAHLSLGYTNMFVEGMTGGRGFMAVAAMNFGAGNPLSAMIASLLFGFSESIGFRLQGAGYAGQFALMIPYILTVIVLTVSMIQKDNALKRSKFRDLEKQIDEMHS